MKVLNIISGLGRGGAEILLKESLPFMKKKGVDSTILSLSMERDALVNELIEDGINVYKTGLNNVYSPRQIFKIEKYLRGYDLIHTHLLPAQYWTILAKIISNNKTPIVTTEHSTNNKRRGKKLFKITDKFIYDKYDKIICISQATKRNLDEWLPNLSAKSTVIYNGINLDKFKMAKPYSTNELLKGVTIDENIKLILMTGRLDIPKDHNTLIKAISLLPNEFHLVLVGRGRLKNKMMSLSKELEISHRVHFLGYRSDVERIMKSVDVYVQSSHWEGFGIAALEAMASGVPVIASDVDGLTEVVKDGGLLFPKGDYIALAKRIKDIFDSEEKYNHIANKCKLKSERFSIEKMVDEYLKTYEELINNKL